MLFRWLAIFLCFVSLTSCRSNGQGEVSNKNVTFISTKISINDGNVLENVSSGIVSLTVSLNTASTIPVSVEYFTQNGMASSGQDYTSATGTITFAPGETRKTISIAVINDTLQEPSTETFTVHLTAPLHAILDKSVGTVTIQDDDDTVRTLTVAPAVTNEGASGINSTLDFVATLSSAAPSDVSVNFTTEDVTANVGSDYRMASGILVIPAGSTTAHIVVDVVGDNTFEPDETIALRLSNVVGVVLNTMTAIGTIRNDDAGMIVNSVQTLESNKGQSAQLVFTVTLVGSHGAVSMNYATVSGTASAGAATETTADYLATSGTLNFAANENSKTITVTVHGDDCLEPNEMFTFAITNITGISGVTSASGVGTIVNDDVEGAPFKVGAAKRIVSPRPADIAGQPHEYCGTINPNVKQFSYLGGFGLRDVNAAPCPLPLPPPFDAIPQGVSLNKQSIDGIQKDWTVRVMVVEQSATNRVAFVTLDAVGAGNIIQKGVRRAINQQTGIPEDNIIFGQSHSHAGADLQGLWGGMPYEWRHYLYAQAGAAAKAAFDSRVDVTLAYASGIVDMPSFNNYRRNNPAFGTDKRLAFLQARRVSDNVVVANLIQYAAHPTVVGADNRKTHPDYLQGLTDYLDNTAFAGSTSLFFNGPQADAQPNPSAADGVEPMPVGESEYARAERMGRVLAQRAATMFNANKKTFDMRQMRLQNVTARLPITNHLFIAIAGKGFFNGYYDFVSPSPDPDARATAAPQAVTLATTLVTRLTFGQVGCTCLEMVTIPGEASNKVGAYIRGLSPHDMALLGLTQNSFGYILDEDQYGSENGETLITEGDPVYPLGYEESVSMGPASAIALREQGWNVLFGATPGTGAGQ